MFSSNQDVKQIRDQSSKVTFLYLRVLHVEPVVFLLLFFLAGRKMRRRSSLQERVVLRVGRLQWAGRQPGGRRALRWAGASSGRRHQHRPAGGLHGAVPRWEDIHSMRLYQTQHSSVNKVLLSTLATHNIKQQHLSYRPIVRSFYPMLAFLLSFSLQQQQQRPQCNSNYCWVLFFLLLWWELEVPLPCSGKKRSYSSHSFWTQFINGLRCAHVKATHLRDSLAKENMCEKSRDSRGCMWL